MDDGARTIEDSLAMLRMAAANGTTAIVATPHSNLEYRFDPPVIAERVAQLKEACDAPIEIYTGCDFHLSYDNIQDALENPRKYTINHKNYLLVEFSDLLIFRNTQDIFTRLGGEGMIPVITHPERNGLLRQRIAEIERWVAEGATVQLTAQSITGGFGKRAQEFCRVLIDRNLAHFAASDGHDVERRPPRMDLARTWLTENYGEEVAEVMCVINPGATLTGDSLERLSISVDRNARRWYQFWR